MVRSLKTGSLLSLLVASFFSVSAHSLQDPTAPLNWTKPKQQESKTVKRRYSPPSLQSIVCENGDQHCYAIINNQMVVDGKSVAGYRIVNITSETVMVSRGGKQWKLELFPEEVKQ